MCMKGYYSLLYGSDIFCFQSAIVLHACEGADDFMRFFFPQKVMVCGGRSCKMILLFCWIIGSLCGAVVASGADSISSLVRACCDASVSTVGLLMVSFLPFLFSAVAVSFSLPWLLRLIALLKAFCFSFCAVIVLGEFGTAGWLCCLLLLFTDILTLPLLCRFQLRHCSAVCRFFLLVFCACLIWSLIVCMVDRSWVVPLLRDII